MKKLTALLFAIVACSGADGIAGLNGTAGPAGPPGADAVFDTAVVVARVVPLVIARLPAPVVPNLDSIVAQVATKIPAGPAGATGATGAQGPAGPQGAKGDKGDAGAVGGALGNVVEGNLLVHGKLCVFELTVPIDPALCSSGAQASIIGENANISMISNWSGTNAQYPGERHEASLGLDSDGGLRLRNNLQGWRFYNADRGQGYAGFDSQTEWSWYQQDVGQGPLGTQSLVLRSDWANKEMYFASWRPGWKVGFRTSVNKYDEILRWTFPAP